MRSKLLEDGSPVLSMYQRERDRGLCCRVEAILPEESRCLLIRVRIDNAGETDTAFCGWSNSERSG